MNNWNDQFVIESDGGGGDRSVKCEKAFWYPAFQDIIINVVRCDNDRAIV